MQINLYTGNESLVLFFLSVEHQMKRNQNEDVRTHQAPKTQTDDATRYKEEEGRVKYIKVTGEGFLFFPFGLTRI